MLMVSLILKHLINHINPLNLIQLFLFQASNGDSPHLGHDMSDLLLSDHQPHLHSTQDDRKHPHEYSYEEADVQGDVPVEQDAQAEDKEGKVGGEDPAIEVAADEEVQGKPEEEIGHQEA